MQRRFILSAIAILLSITAFSQSGKYSFINFPVDGLYAVSSYTSDDSKMGAIDVTGREILPLKYNFISIVNDSTIEACLNGKCGIIDAKGNVLVPFKYEYLYHSNDNLFIADNNKIIDRSGKVIYTAPSGETIKECNKEYVMVSKDGQVGLRTIEGKQVVPAIYDLLMLPTEGRVAVVKDDLLGYTDLNGQVVIPIKYTYSLEWLEEDYFDCRFHEGLAPVMFDDLIGYIDVNGKTVLPFKYSWAEPFINGKAVVATIENDEYNNFKIDKTGRKLSDPANVTEQDLKEGLAPYFDETTWKVGYKDAKTGKILIPAKYTSGSRFSNGYALVRIGEGICIIDKTGKVVLKDIAAFSYFDAA